MFETFVDQGGSRFSTKDVRKNCNINLDLHYPNGWSYSVFFADVRGYASLPVGVVAEYSASIHFTGRVGQILNLASIEGPYTGKFILNEQF